MQNILIETIQNNTIYNNFISTVAPNIDSAGHGACAIALSSQAGGQITNTCTITGMSINVTKKPHFITSDPPDGNMFVSGFTKAEKINGSWHIKDTISLKELSR